MNYAVLNRRIDPDEPLQDAMAMLRAAHAIVAETAPVVRAATSRLRRSFRRAPEAAPQVGITHTPQSGNRTVFSRSDMRPGASRYYSRDMGRAFSVQAGMPASSVRPRTDRRLTMASRLLMAGSLPRHRQPARPATPHVDLMAVLQNRSRAIALAGGLSYRFQQNMLDMRDGTPDMARTFRQQARHGKGMQLIYV